MADVQTLPDLALSAGGIDITPDFPHAGDSLHFAVEVLNQGDQPSPASTLELKDAAGNLLASSPVPALAGHQQTTLGLDWTPPGGPGDYGLLARVNTPATFPELDLVNNAASFSVALQDGNLYVSNQIFSPNGDGVKDSATFFFRLPAAAIEILDRDGDLLRRLPTGGGQSVLWDGRSERGLLARDGIYKARLADGPEPVETWVAVDNNLTGIGQDVKQRLLVGFLEPQLPGGYPERSFFESLIVNPVGEEIYAVEHYQKYDEGTDAYTLRRFDGEEMVELGDYPPQGRELLSVDGTGTLFVAGYQWDSSYDLLQYPGPTVTELYLAGRRRLPALALARRPLGGLDHQLQRRRDLPREPRERRAPPFLLGRPGALRRLRLHRELDPQQPAGGLDRPLGLGRFLLPPRRRHRSAHRRGPPGGGFLRGLRRRRPQPRGRPAAGRRADGAAGRRADGARPAAARRRRGVTRAPTWAGATTISAARSTSRRAPSPG